jgi:hypothetical protein
VISEQGESVAQRVRMAGITENAAHTDNHRSDQDDEPNDYDHDVLRTLRCRFVLGTVRPERDAGRQKTLRAAGSPLQRGQLRSAGESLPRGRCHFGCGEKKSGPVVYRKKSTVCLGSGGTATTLHFHDHCA